MCAFSGNQSDRIVGSEGWIVWDGRKEGDIESDEIAFLRSVNPRTGLIKAHISIVLFGLSGVLAKVITQTSTVVTGGRSLIAAILLGLFLFARGRMKRLPQGSRTTLGISGVLLAFHWICFYQSVKVGSVSIGVISVSTFPIMTAIVEPFVMRQPWKWKLLIDPALVIIGTLILLGDKASPSDTEGLLWGFCSAAIYVIIHFINKVNVREMEGSMLSFVQLSIAGLVLLPFFIMGWDTSGPSHGQDILLLIFLGIFSTAIAYSYFIESMRHIPASTAAVLCGLEPVYAIGISLAFLDEEFSWNLMIGAAVILVSVVHSSYRGASDEDALHGNDTIIEPPPL